ncbi:hypothetical protein MLD38_029404 [Melastoma candidum]|uniref:Uncharacterized protein n=1 Tax=Melastoma candidum TaxID=119954 RepID=A0ACB9N647_9MYRT|nr:hypothetical protein MLD38_029404 [Melastoma candidum]
MSGDSTYLPHNEDMSPSQNLNLTLQGSRDSEEPQEDEVNGFQVDSHEIEEDGRQDAELNENEQLLQLKDNEHILHRNNLELSTRIELNDPSRNGDFDSREYLPPVVGMEFDSYDDAYNYYHSYAKEVGFAIRIKSSWTKRNSKEKRGAVLCCNCEGFKMIKEASTQRKETRTGCPAMIRLRLVQSNSWRVDEVKLGHNHLFDPVRVKNSKSHRKMDGGAKRKVEPNLTMEIRTIKLYRTPVMDGVNSVSVNTIEPITSHERKNSLKLNMGDAQVIQNFLCHAQIIYPNFFYSVDLNDEGCLRNVLWINSCSRAAYAYFDDVVTFDTTYLSDNYQVPLFAFIGVNNHKQSILLGCGLVADQTVETFIWMFRTWISCMSGRPPQMIISDRCSALESAIGEVFPRANHVISLSSVMKSIYETLAVFPDSEALFSLFNSSVYDSLKIEDFELSWQDIRQRFGLRDLKEIQTIYEIREKWAPAYLKGTFSAGLHGLGRGHFSSPFFNSYLTKDTSVKEFFGNYEIMMQNKMQKEASDELESKDLGPLLKTSCCYELQLSKLYTKAIFIEFQDEVVKMSSCLTITPVHSSGPLCTYLVKEVDVKDGMENSRNFEVIYDKAGMEVRCICNCMNFKGYLCCHALSVLNNNGVKEIPSFYILSRWRKDVPRSHVLDCDSGNIDLANPLQWHDHLYRKAMQVVEVGMISTHHCTVALQAFQEALNKIHLLTDNNS